MQAAQRDIHGGFKINVEAQIAQEQLIHTLQDVVSSSLKVCQLSLVVGLTDVQPDLQFKGVGRSRADSCRPAPARPPRGRADEWRPRYSGDAGAKADLHRDASRDGGRDEAGAGVPDAARGRPVAG
jgi:hypothetical protein